MTGGQGHSVKLAGHKKKDEDLNWQSAGICLYQYRLTYLGTWWSISQTGATYAGWRGGRWQVGVPPQKVRMTGALDTVTSLAVFCLLLFSFMNPLLKPCTWCQVKPIHNTADVPTNSQ